MNYKNLMLFLAFAMVSQFATAQSFQIPFARVSSKKIAKLILNNGDVLEVNVSKLKRKKGQITEVTYKDAKDKKVTLEADKIKEMYVPPTDWEKIGKVADIMNDVTKLGDNQLDSEMLDDGYIYFVQTEVQLTKKKKMTLLMQLVNPAFGSKIKVFHDPFASETASVGVGGMTLAGGDEKSYYVQRGDDTAFRMKKKDYDDEFEYLFKDCKKVMKEFGDKAKWSKFAEAVYMYETECTK